jgi:hypothetical protein
MPVSADIINGDFETGNFTGWTLFGTHNPTLVDLGGEYGNYTASCSGNGETTYAGLYQEYDNALYSKIELDMLYNRVGGNAHFYIYDNEDIIYSLGPYELYNGNISVNLTDYNGQGKIYFRAYYQGYARIDNVVLTSYEVPPDVDDVFWGSDPYYTGEIGKITTNIVDFDDTTYDYYLDLYNTNDYFTTYQITSPIESNYYTFPTEWTDTSLLAKLQRTLADGTGEVNLAMGLSHFETLNWDTTISFDQSSYDPGDTLTVSWSGAPTSSTIWLRAGNDGEIIETNVDYSGSFQFTIPANTEETYYFVDVIVSGTSHAQASCVINLGDYFTSDYIFVTDYSFSDGDTYMLHNVDRAEWLNVTTETNINVDFVDVYYNNVYDDRMVSVDHIENLDGTDQVLKFPNDMGSGQYITIILYHNISTGTDVELSYYTNVGEKGEGIDIYNAVITLDDTKEVLDVESITGYGGNDLVVPLDMVVIFDIYADEIINSSTVTEENLYEGDANYNSTADYHLKRSYLFDVVGLSELEFTVHNDETNTDDILKYKVYVEGVDQSELDGSVVMYWTKSNIELGDHVLLYFNVSNMPANPILTISSTGENKYTTERTLSTNQTGTESIPENYHEAGIFTATLTCNDIMYAISTLTIVDPDIEIEEDDDDIAFDTKFESMLSSGAFVALLIIIACVGAFGKIGGVVGVFLGMVVGISISFLMGYLPAWILFIMVLALCVVFVSKLINSFGGGE